MSRDPAGEHATPARPPRQRAVLILINLLAFWLALPAGLWWAGQAVERSAWWAALIATLPASALPLAACPPLRWLAWALGALLVALGGWLCGHAMLALRRHGRGLPISALPPTRLVTAGPYRHLRHPIYTGYTLALVGAGLLLASPGLIAVSLIFTACWLAIWVKGHEEPVLLRRYGPLYRRYREEAAFFLPLGGRWLAWRLTRLALRLIVRGGLRVEGAAHLPPGPFVLVTDHLSYLDLLFAQLVPRRLLIPVTAEVFRKPAVAWFLRLLGAVPTRRWCPDPQAAEALAGRAGLGLPLGVAVEGERSWTGEMQLPAARVARNLRRLGLPLVPAAFVGSYRLWPRWAGGPDRRAAVTVRLGPAFTPPPLATARPAGPDQQAPAVAVEPALAPDEQDRELAQELRRRVLALRDPAELAVDLRRFPGARPTLALWRCPRCKADEALAFAPGPQAALACGACGARWQADDGGLVQTVPPEAAGERRTLAGWCALAGEEPRLPAVDSVEDAPLLAGMAEWREEPDGAAPLARLRSLGLGQVRVDRQAVGWSGGVTRVLPLPEIATVTTERNDTVQLGLRAGGVVQLVLDGPSPRRWQVYLRAVLPAGGAHAPATPERPPPRGV